MKSNEFESDQSATPLLNESIFFLMGVVYRRFRNEAQEQLLEQHDITTEMQKALEILSFYQELPQQALADKLMKERSTVKRLVDNMHKRDLVEFIPHPTNLKVKLIKLSAKGREVHASGNQIVTATQQEWLSSLGIDDELALKRALIRMLESN
ncbi:transcriptional regulator [Vibrio ishigakensis]|uniref:Transcriptional regulator n=1 Tax=Vibrio ishigakensis TaxID=1481914 RepID=A0A0B8Q396_9VIBR|nr:transcriptional regulator [Vibrio sp. JCM 19236]GAM74070.1 transcriptional regulator [Vibrio ishigakensis]